MTTILHDKFDKHSLSQLPKAIFPGKIVVILNEIDAKKAVDYLLSCDLLGFDTETKPVFKKGQYRKVALMQVSTREICFLFRLNLIGLPDCLIRLLEDTTVPKVGLSLNDDMMMLRKRSEFQKGTFIDLQSVVGSLGIEDMSLQKIYANLFQERITKREQLSNWEADILTEKQKQYAATDAWACVMIYERLRELKKTKDFKLVKTIEEEETD
ncbi:MAG: 3'-5' exonuclease [Prevotella sp.]|nr:3'-5' exonuclease domain-containing protein 2 [Prevotella sp.]MDD7273692.1 3'-5' exonuclease domain-containing protein 2 [Prevotellaceae bacterium]MDY3935433.1 3'-5' exonuclease [Prevotella sp.]MDY4217733.1 3'-5' exonuclease [Prevotella sp.]